MNITIPVFKTRLSPLFDSCQKLLLIQWDGERELSRELISIKGDHPLKRVDALINLNTSILICGAISKFTLSQIISSGINVIPHLSGEFEEILTAFKNNRLRQTDKYLMPGCCSRRQRRCQRNRKGHRS